MGSLHLWSGLLLTAVLLPASLTAAQSAFPADAPATACSIGQTKPCGSNIGECSAGVQVCVSGEWGVCTNGIGPRDEACNGLDDDCDGGVDEQCRSVNLCTNGVRDPSEEGIDCGGSCAACDAGVFNYVLIASGIGLAVLAVGLRAGIRKLHGKTSGN